MRIPKDQGLFFTAFFLTLFGIILTTWIFLPVYHREAEEDEANPSALTERLMTPEELVKKAEKVLLQAESALSQLTPEKGKPDKPASKSRKKS